MHDDGRPIPVLHDRGEGIAHLGGHVLGACEATARMAVIAIARPAMIGDVHHVGDALVDRVSIDPAVALPAVELAQIVGMAEQVTVHRIALGAQELRQHDPVSTEHLGARDQGSDPLLPVWWPSPTEIQAHDVGGGVNESGLELRPEALAQKDVVFEDHTPFAAEVVEPSPGREVIVGWSYPLVPADGVSVDVGGQLGGHLGALMVSDDDDGDQLSFPSTGSVIRRS
jgi:hypothetical protein